MTFYEFKMLKTDKGMSDVSLFGAFSSGSVVEFCFSAPRKAAIYDVDFLAHSDGNYNFFVYKSDFKCLENGRDVFSVTLHTDNILKDSEIKKTGLFYYRWETFGPNGKRFFGGERPTLLTEYNNPADAERQLLVYSEDYKTPSRYNGGIVYQIFPDRFCKSGKCREKAGKVRKSWNDEPSFPEYPGAPHPCSDFFGGDLYGIAEKLGYLKKLGVTAIYLNPVFESSSNHRYDTADMMRVDDLLGGDKALSELIRSAEKCGIKIILDGVFNHTGSDSVYFNKFGTFGKGGAYNDKTSKYFPWYYFDEYPGKYKAWWGVDVLPKVNCDEPSYRAFIKDRFLKKWMSYGAGGWRIDVADELTDDFLDYFRKSVKESDPDALIIGEVWEDASNKVSYGKRRDYLLGNAFDGVMNYPLRNAIISYLLSGDTEQLRDSTEGLYRRYPKGTSDVLFNILGSHDTVRILTALAGQPDNGATNAEKSVSRLTVPLRELSERRLKAAYSAVCSLPGLPVIYYGDEAGMEGYGDPFCRRTFPWGKENSEMIAFFCEEGQKRIKEPVLSNGLFKIVYLDSELFGFIRFSDSGDVDGILTVLNRCEKKFLIQYPEGSFTVDPISTVKKKISPCCAAKLNENQRFKFYSEPS